MQSGDKPVELRESVEERVESIGLDRVTEAERAYYLIDNFVADYQNGGILQYLHNQDNLAPKLVTSLAVIGASDASNAVEQCITLDAQGKGASDDVGADRVLRAAKASGLNDLVDALAEQLEIYAANHDAQFVGPRTKLDLWKSRRARGADTAPRRVNPIDLDAEAVRDATTTSRPCPVCGQPCPTYRKSCKRCGYPLGRT
jgi:hypothetical protein